MEKPRFIWKDLYELNKLTTCSLTVIALIYSSYINIVLLLFSITLNLNTINLSWYHIFLISWATTMSVVLYKILLRRGNDKITYSAGTAMSKIKMELEYADTIIASFPYLWFYIQFPVRFYEILLFVLNQKSWP